MTNESTKPVEPAKDLKEAATPTEAPKTPVHPTAEEMAKKYPRAYDFKTMG